MNVNFGLLEDYDKRKKEQVARRALKAAAAWIERVRKDSPEWTTGALRKIKVTIGRGAIP